MMKKITAILLCLIMITACFSLTSCRTGGENGPSETPLTSPEEQPTVQPTEPPTEEPTEEPTPEPTEEPAGPEEIYAVYKAASDKNFSVAGLKLRASSSSLISFSLQGEPYMQEVVLKWDSSYKNPGRSDSIKKSRSEMTYGQGDTAFVSATDMLITPELLFFKEEGEEKYTAIDVNSAEAVSIMGPVKDNFESDDDIKAMFEGATMRTFSGETVIVLNSASESMENMIRESMAAVIGSLGTGIAASDAKILSAQLTINISSEGYLTKLRQRYRYSFTVSSGGESIEFIVVLEEECYWSDFGVEQDVEIPENAVYYNVDPEVSSEISAAVEKTSAKGLHFEVDRSEELLGGGNLVLASNSSKGAFKRPAGYMEGGTLYYKHDFLLESYGTDDVRVFTEVYLTGDKGIYRDEPEGTFGVYERSIFDETFMDAEVDNILSYSPYVLSGATLIQNGDGSKTVKSVLSGEQAYMLVPGYIESMKQNADDAAGDDSLSVTVKKAELTVKITKDGYIEYILRELVFEIVGGTDAYDTCKVSYHTEYKAVDPGTEVTITVPDHYDPGTLSA